MQLHRGEWVPAGRNLALTVFAMGSAWSAAAQMRPTQEVPAFRADSTLVLVPVAVVDRGGAIVNGLGSNAFTLTENGVRQEIRSFSQEDVPVSMGIVLDLSGSMRGVLSAAKETLRALMKDANPADEAFLNTVTTRPRAYFGFTNHFDEVLSRIALENAGGDTALIDTIYDSLKELRSGIHTRKALLVISDGMDNHSRYSKLELLARAMESDAQIYTIAVANGAPTLKPIQQTEEKQGVLFLDELSAKTGGISFIVRGQADIAEAAASIGQALRNQYTIGYVPRGDGRNGQWRRIRVKVAGAGMRAYARAGYRLESSPADNVNNADNVHNEE
jgi:Ca-activated chloride channel family protein